MSGYSDFNNSSNLSTAIEDLTDLFDSTGGVTTLEVLADDGTTIVVKATETMTRAVERVCNVLFNQTDDTDNFDPSDDEDDLDGV